MQERLVGVLVSLVWACSGVMFCGMFGFFGRWLYVAQGSMKSLHAPYLSSGDLVDLVLQRVLLFCLLCCFLFMTEGG